MKSCRDKTDDLDALSVLFSTAGYSMDTVFVALFATTVEVVSCKNVFCTGEFTVAIMLSFWCGSRQRHAFGSAEIAGLER